MHSANIIDIQQEVLRILQNTQDVLSDLKDSEVVVSNDSSDQKQTIEANNLKNIESTIRNESQKATNMEMVVAVVGTMKSGKSTTINAIVGQEILPNRALPMTALPTLVTHRKGFITPVLTFSHPQPLMELSENIANKLKTTEISSGYAFLGSDDGKALVQKLTQESKLEIKEEYKGQEEIFNFLHKLNDLMRAAKELSITPPYEEYEAIDSLPRIEVEFFHLKNNDDSDHGRLSILDTPGPNEFGQSEALKKVFRRQLAQASAVLLVMDYTQLNSEADGTVREEIASMQDSLGDRLFALVNKFDNASKNTMDADATKKYVSEHLLNKIPSERIFPVSSWWAYLANRALNELDHQGKINEDDDWVEDFGEEALGRRWRNKIDDNEEVKDVSLALWEDSNFANPLKLVITEAHAKVAFDSLGSTLTKLSSIFNQLDTGVNGRLSGLQTDIDSLNKMIEDLQSDQKTLNDIEASVDKKVNEEIAKSTAKITKTLNKYIDEATELTRKFLETGKIEIEKSKKREEEKEQKEKADRQERSIFGSFGLSGGNHNKNRDEIEEAFKSGDVIQYDDEDDAKKLLESIDEEISKITTILFSESEKVLQTGTKNLQQSLNANVKKELAEVLEQAKERLKDQGVNVNFKLPSFDKQSNLSFTMDDLVSSGIEKHTYEKERSRVKSGGWSWFKNKLNDDWGREDYTTTETGYKVDILMTKEKIEKNMQALRKSIENSQMTFLESQLKDNINQQISDVKEYLARYRGDLMQGVKDQQDDSQKKNNYIKELESFLKPFRDLSEDTDDQLSLLNQLNNS